MPPRIDQIDELTRGIELPFRPLHLQHLQVIVEALSAAWADLLDRHQPILFHQDEAEINALMETKLLALLDDDPLLAQMVRAIARGRETLSFDGTHLEKRPDLSLFFTCRNPAFPLVIECKIIDKADGKSARLYCDRGISRFLVGEYAWATREAIMVGYVRDESTIASSLAPLFVPSACGRAPCATKGGISAVSPPPPNVATSSHARTFCYPYRRPPHDSPGAITLWHLWLPAAQSLVDVAKPAAGISIVDAGSASAGT
jgi:hypothetical protein